MYCSRDVYASTYTHVERGKRRAGGEGSKEMNKGGGERASQEMGGGGGGGEGEGGEKGEKRWREIK